LRRPSIIPCEAEEAFDHPLRSGCQRMGGKRAHLTLPRPWAGEQVKVDASRLPASGSGGGGGSEDVSSTIFRIFRVERTPCTSPYRTGRGRHTGFG
jgi:hypothetical protein